MACHDIVGHEVKKRLQELKKPLRECIEPQYGLLDHLVSSNVLTMEDKLKILPEKSSPYIQCDMLLSIMQEKTPEQSEQFLDDLKSTGQEHVVNFIVQNACRFKSDHTKFCCWPLENIYRDKITKNLSKLVVEMDCKNNTLIDALLACHCINDEQRQSITEGPSTLEEMNRKLLTMLLRRSIRDYNKFVECLEKSGMPHVVREFHLDVCSASPSAHLGPGGNVTSSRLSDTRSPALKSFESSDQSKELPKSVAPQASSQADVTKSKTTELQFHGNLIFSPTRPPTDKKDQPLHLSGVTVVGKNVYVVYSAHDTIFKYDEDDVTVTDFIPVKGMYRPSDMVGDSQREMLFVSDLCNVIWCVSLDKKKITKFAKLFAPLSLSLVDTRLLVTLKSLVRLVMLDSLSGLEIEKIPLPKDPMRGKALHSIESGRRTLIVGYKNAVIEIDFNGCLIHMFNSEEQLTYIHLALDSVGDRLFVVNYIENRIFVLNEQLKFQGILFDNEQLGNRQPSRLNYDKINNRLAVGLDDGFVEIFEC